jgi:hypothetical protein
MFQANEGNHLKNKRTFPLLDFFFHPRKAHIVSKLSLTWGLMWGSRWGLTWALNERSLSDKLLIGMVLQIWCTMGQCEKKPQRYFNHAAVFFWKFLISFYLICKKTCNPQMKYTFFKWFLHIRKNYIRHFQKKTAARGHPKFWSYFQMRATKINSANVKDFGLSDAQFWYFQLFLFSVPISSVPNNWKYWNWTVCGFFIWNQRNRKCLVGLNGITKNRDHHRTKIWVLWPPRDLQNALLDNKIYAKT